MHRPSDSTDGRTPLRPRAQGSKPEASAESHAAPGPTDADLLHRLAASDRQAFETLYLRHRQDVLNFLRSRYTSLNDHAAEDVASETLWRVWQDRIRLGSVDNLYAYLKTIAKNIVARAFRDQRPDEVELSSYIAAPGLSPREALQRDEVSRQVAQAVKSLAKSHRLALQYSQAGLSARQIAARLGSTENAARILVQKARRELTRLLSRCGDSCAVDDGHPEKCPAKKENLQCLKYQYVRRLQVP